MRSIESNMPNSPPPPTYEEAVLCSVDPHLRQNHAHHHMEHPQPRQATDNTTTDPPKLVLSSQKSCHPALTYTHADNTSVSCVLELVDAAIEADFTAGPDSRNYMTTPAIIIHSAISTPGDDECNYFDKFNSSSNKNNPVLEQQGIHNEKHNKKVPSFSENMQEARNSAEVDPELKIIDRLQKDKNGAELSYHTITKDHSSIIYGNEVVDSKRVAIGPCRECRTANGFDRRSSTTSDHVKSCKVGTESVVCSSKRGHAQPRFYSHESLIRKSHQKNCVQSNEISNSMDEAWCQMDRSRADSCSSSPNMRQRSGTLDDTTTPFTQNFKQASSDRRSTTVLMPTRSNFSKSYSDLSSRHHVAYRRDSSCGRSMYKCRLCHCSSTRDCRCLIAPKSHKQHNLSGSRVNRSVEENRISKHHLLPEARHGPGSRSIRSVSVDDVRMRGGIDDYEWKDGKVQLKNGGISHGESVRYVWKDGHVEKITSDANNEDTQVEILEPSDSKTCSKINPVVVCVFLLAVIAVVIIIPVYFSS